MRSLYGIPTTKVLDENHPQKPVNPYGESKLLIERACQWYEAAYDFRYVSLRYFNAAGADPTGEIGESHHPETHLMPLTISAALGQYPVLNVYGIDFTTRDGTAVRDYIHVSDVAAGHVSALNYLEARGASTRLNLGTGRGVTVREVIETVERISGASIRTREMARRPGGRVEDWRSVPKVKPSLLLPVSSGSASIAEP